MEERVVRTMLSTIGPGGEGEEEDSTDDEFSDASDVDGILFERNNNRQMMTPSLKLPTDVTAETVSNDVSLEEALEEGRQMMIKFIDNRFDEAVEFIFQKGSQNFIYAAGMGVIKSIECLMTMNTSHIQEAINYMKFANEFSNQRRKRHSYTSMISSSLFRSFDYNSYTDEEAHAELIYAGTQIALGLLSIIEDQSIYGIINAAFTIRSSHSTYKECLNILNSKTNWSSDKLREHFESGTRLGIGAFDLFVSMFPNKLAKLLEYVGFHSDRDVALDELNKSVNLPDGYMYDLSSILLSTYYGFVEYFYGVGEGEVEFFEKQSKVWARRTPNSSIARIGLAIQQQITGNPDGAIDLYKKCVFDSSETFKQLELAAYWGVAGCHFMKGEWADAAHHINILREGCKWSPALFTYLYAIFQLMRVEEEGRLELVPEISECFKAIPKLKRTVGGRKVFHEKIVIERSKRYRNNVTDMIIPPLELLYIWNMFNMMCGRKELIEPFIKRIDNKFATYKGDKDDDDACLDAYAYLIFMRGVCLRHLGQSDDAIRCFQDVLSCKKRIEHETHLLPQACFEIGSIERKKGNLTEAKKWLKRAKDDYSNYMTEVMIQHRTHHLLKCIKKERRERQEDDDDD